MLLWQGIVHDISKFRPDEWFAYADYFYGPKQRCNKANKVKAAFDLAWLRHQHRNSHHWEYYLTRDKAGATIALEMSPADTIEMICDWVGSGRAITGKNDVWDWYCKNRDQIQLHEQTRAVVEVMLCQRGLKCGVDFLARLK